MISFTVTKDELDQIQRIVARGQELAKRHGAEYSVMNMSMDITATHANGTPLDLGGLANADDHNFSHDLFGIARHINRETGKLEGCFVPRFALRPVSV
jgi:hypothetical protein